MKFDKSGKCINFSLIENDTQLKKCKARIAKLQSKADVLTTDEQDELGCLVPLVNYGVATKPKAFHTGEGMVEVPLPPHLVDLFPEYQVERCPCVHKTEGQCIRVKGHASLDGTEDTCIFAPSYGA